MNLFYRIADGNMDGAVSLLRDKYDIIISRTDIPDNAAYALATIVDENGESALKSVLNIHPDKDAIVHYFGQADATLPATTPVAISPMMPVATTIASPLQSNNNTKGFDETKEHYKTLSLLALVIGGVVVGAILAKK